ncbi:MAG: hypothetical protein JWL63_677 [Rhodocyclales bacterium]|nr:hypothetical protein [Rhodocyclales bacterium]
MADFEDYAGTAASIALEIERKLITLNIDWHDPVALKQLASEALQYDKNRKFPGLEAAAPGQLAHMELCGLIALMHRTIGEGAVDGQSIHGNDAWKALARALWAEKGSGGSAPSKDDGST